MAPPSSAPPIRAHPDGGGEARPVRRGAHQGDAQPRLDGGGCIQAHAHGCVARFPRQASSLVLVHPGRGIHFFRACRQTPGGAGENRPRAARGEASGFASAGPGKAGIDARRQNRNPGAPGDCAEAGHAGQPPTPRGTNRSGSWMPEFAPIRTMSRPFTRADRSMRRTGTFPAPSKTSMRCPARPEGCRGAQQSLLGARHHQRSFRRTEGLQRGAAASTPLRRCLRQARPGTPEKGIVR